MRLRPLSGFWRAAVALIAATSAWPALAQSPPGGARDVRFAVFHRPGPAWVAGRSMFDQPSIRAHVDHYRKWLESGKLELGGPHLDEQGGGMMIPRAGLSAEEVKAFALEDPAVRDGTLLAEVRPWLIGMRR